MESKITISEETQIDRPANREFFAVEKKDFTRIRRMIKALEDISGFWSSAAWAVGGVSASLWVIYFFDQYKDGTGKILLIVSIFTSFITALLFIFSRLSLKSLDKSKGIILEEMDQMESVDKKGAADPVNLTIISPLIIESAIYGIKDRYNDVKDILVGKIKNNTINEFVTNSLFEDKDPYPGKLKELKIEYTLNGHKHRKTIEEGSILQIF